MSASVLRPQSRSPPHGGVSWSMPCTVDVNDATGSPPTQGVSCSQEVEQPESIFLSSPPVGRGLKCYCEQRFICANPFAPPHGA